MATTDDLTEYKAHTWRRNSRAIGIALACCVDAVAYADGRVILEMYHRQNCR